MIELHFPVLGDRLTVDHGYFLYSAISQMIPAVHQEEFTIGISPIQANYTGDGQLLLQSRKAKVCLRLPSEKISTLLLLAGKSLKVGENRIRLGVPQVCTLTPAPTLFSRIVLIKGFTESEPFREACRRQLDEMGVKGKVQIPLVQSGIHESKPRRRVMQIKSKSVVGFSVQLTDLSTEDSLRVQEQGIGGRRKMGCGFFMPMKLRGEK